MWKQSSNKYHAKKTEVEGIQFDSKAEATFYRDYLLPLIKAKKIIIERQVSFHLKVNDVLITKYIADFLVTEKNGNQLVYEVKGMMLNDALIKLRWFEGLYGIPVYIVRSINNIERLKGYNKRK